MGLGIWEGLKRVMEMMVKSCKQVTNQIPSLPCFLLVSNSQGEVAVVPEGKCCPECVGSSCQVDDQVYPVSEFLIFFIFLSYLSPYKSCTFLILLPSLQKLVFLLAVRI